MTTHRFAQLIAGATFLLLIAGALVTSTGSGLSVPDWPLSYGTLFPPMKGGIRFEHTHRLIAGAVALLTIAFAFWLRHHEPRRWVRQLGLAAVGVVLAQALLGGITVLCQLPCSVSVAHACLAQTFFCLAVTLAFVTSRRWHDAAPHAGRSALPWLSLATTATIFLQLLLGAALRHSGRGLTIHLIGAVAVALTVLRLLIVVRRQPPRDAILTRSADLIAILLLMQLSLGALAVWIHPTVLVRTAHVVTGALVLASALILTLWAWRLTPPPSARAWQQLPAYVELTKPRLTSLAVVTTAVGFLLGAHGAPDWPLLLATVLGTALVGGGAGALNQYLERDADALMERTKHRPLPAGRLEPAAGLRYGVLLSVAGLWLLSWRVNALAASLAALTLIAYLFLYTPLKRRTTLCTLVGAVPGALPPLIGWAAARNALHVEAWVLFAILFLWQLPHFLALAWLYREDYARAGFQMLTVDDRDGAVTARQMALYCVALIPAALIPTLLGVTGACYFFGALALSVAFCGCGIAAAIGHSRAAARRLFLASITYLPALLTLMTVDHAVLVRMP